MLLRSRFPTHCAIGFRRLQVRLGTSIGFFMCFSFFRSLCAFHQKCLPSPSGSHLQYEVRRAFHSPSSALWYFAASPCSRDVQPQPTLFARLRLPAEFLLFELCLHPSLVLLFDPAPAASSPIGHHVLTVNCCAPLLSARCVQKRQFSDVCRSQLSSPFGQRSTGLRLSPSTSHFSLPVLHSVCEAAPRCVTQFSNAPICYCLSRRIPVLLPCAWCTETLIIMRCCARHRCVQGP